MLGKRDRLERGSSVWANRPRVYAIMACFSMQAFSHRFWGLTRSVASRHERDFRTGWRVLHGNWRRFVERCFRRFIVIGIIIIGIPVGTTPCRRRPIRRRLRRIGLPSRDARHRRAPVGSRSSARGASTFGTSSPRAVARSIWCSCSFLRISRISSAIAYSPSASHWRMRTR